MSIGGETRFLSDRPPGNPFATRFTRPGAIPPLDRHGRPVDVAALIARLQPLGAAAIVGPHGHGKTTLLVAIAVALASGGHTVKLLRARRRADAFSAFAAIAMAPARAVMCIDGWESLGSCRWPLRQAARLLGRLLIVTSHGPAGLPALWTCGTTEDLLRAIIARLPDHGGRIAADDVATAFRRHGGNLRESLSHLYDRYERIAAPPSAPCGA